LPGRRMQNYKFLNHIVLWNVFFAIICIPTAGKLIDVLGIPLSISIYYFPFVYIFGDITTEVYGYAVARRVLWYCIFAQLLVIAIFEFVIFYPPSTVMTNNQSYVDVLSTAPRLVLFGTLAMFAGDIANNYVLAKLKVWTDGRYISARFVTSTLCGQMVNTAVFYIFGLWGMIPTRILTKSIVAATLTKVGVELILLPVTLRISLWLKRMENVDYFDRATNFNPLKF
jgi:queuosine precursor transporter